MELERPGRNSVITSSVRWVFDRELISFRPASRLLLRRDEDLTVFHPSHSHLIRTKTSLPTPQFSSSPSASLSLLPFSQPFPSLDSSTQPDASLLHPSTQLHSSPTSSIQSYLHLVPMTLQPFSFFTCPTRIAPAGSYSNSTCLGGGTRVEESGFWSEGEGF